MKKLRGYRLRWSECRDSDISKYSLKMKMGSFAIKGYQDFTKSSVYQLKNRVYLLIYNIVALSEEIRRVVSISQKDFKDEVVGHLKNCHELNVLIDLSDRDKHPYEPRDKGKSKVLPHLVNVKGYLKLSPNSVKGSAVCVKFSSKGLTKAGDGSAEVVVTGDVVDKNGNTIGVLDSIVNKALKCLEEVIEKVHQNNSMK